jgi:hypothetical protein
VVTDISPPRARVSGYGASIPSAPRPRPRSARSRGMVPPCNGPAASPLHGGRVCGGDGALAERKRPWDEGPRGVNSWTPNHSKWRLYREQSTPSRRAGRGPAGVATASEAGDREGLTRRPYGLPPVFGRRSTERPATNPHIVGTRGEKKRRLAHVVSQKNPSSVYPDNSVPGGSPGSTCQRAASRRP